MNILFVIMIISVVWVSSSIGYEAGISRGKSIILDEMKKQIENNKECE